VDDGGEMARQASLTASVQEFGSVTSNRCPATADMTMIAKEVAKPQNRIRADTPSQAIRRFGGPIAFIS